MKLTPERSADLVMRKDISKAMSKTCNFSSVHILNVVLSLDSVDIVIKAIPYANARAIGLHDAAREIQKGLMLNSNHDQ